MGTREDSDAAWPTGSTQSTADPLQAAELRPLGHLGLHRAAAAQCCRPVFSSGFAITLLSQMGI